MNIEIDGATPVSCPPHYWLIERLSMHRQHWTCRRCGEEQDHDDATEGLHRWQTQLRSKKTS